MENYFLLGLACLGIGWLFSNYVNRQEGLTKTAMFWANYAEPLIYRQWDLSSRDATIAAHENALKMLKEHGNQHIKTKDVYLWVYGAEEQLMNVDFAEWSYQANALEIRIRDEYRKEKDRLAKAANIAGGAAKTFAGQKDDFNDIGE